MFLATFAHFVARAIVLLMRFFATRVAYADNFGRTFARGMASCTACAAHSVRTRASLLAMPRLRAKRTVIRAVFLVGSMRFRSTISTNHRVCDPMMIRFRFLLPPSVVQAEQGGQPRMGWPKVPAEAQQSTYAAAT